MSTKRVVFKKPFKRPAWYEDRGPFCPLGIELAQSGTPLGVWLQRKLDSARVVVIDCDGVLQVLQTGGLDSMVRWSVRCGFRIYHSFSGLSRALRAGRCLGFVPGRLAVWDNFARAHLVLRPEPFSGEWGAHSVSHEWFIQWRADKRAQHAAESAASMHARQAWVDAGKPEGLTSGESPGAYALFRPLLAESERLEAAYHVKVAAGEY